MFSVFVGFFNRLHKRFFIAKVVFHLDEHAMEKLYEISGNALVIYYSEECL